MIAVTVSLLSFVFQLIFSHFGQLARSKNMGAEIKKSKDNAPTIYELGKMWIGEEYETGEYETDSDGNRKLSASGEPIMIKAYRYHEDLIRERFLKPAPVCWADPHPKRYVLSVACGELFILVVARDGGFDTSVYSAGHNGYGKQKIWKGVQILTFSHWQCLDNLT